MGTNPEPVDAAAAALDAWLAFLGAGSTESASSAGLRLSEMSFTQAHRFPTVPGGPVLIAATKGTAT
jgi:hypothetical protein